MIPRRKLGWVTREAGTPRVYQPPRARARPNRRKKNKIPSPNRVPCSAAAPARRHRTPSETFRCIDLRAGHDGQGKLWRCGEPMRWQADTDPSLFFSRQG